MTSQARTSRSLIQHMKPSPIGSAIEQEHIQYLEQKIGEQKQIIVQFTQVTSLLNRQFNEYLVKQE